MKKKRERTRDKYWSEDLPNNDIDFIEVPLPDQDSHGEDENNYDDAKDYDSFAPKRNKISKCLIDIEDPDSLEKEMKSQKRKQRLLRKIFKAASEVLTDIQMKVFTMRAVYGINEVVIARTLQVNQPMVSLVWKASVKKIRKALRIKIKDLPLALESDIVKKD